MMFEIDGPGKALRVSWTPAPDKWIVIFFLRIDLKLNLLKVEQKLTRPTRPRTSGLQFYPLHRS